MHAPVFPRNLGIRISVSQTSASTAMLYSLTPAPYFSFAAALRSPWRNLAFPKKEQHTQLSRQSTMERMSTKLVIERSVTRFSPS